MMLSSPGALLRFSLFIDASTSDCSMGSASVLEVVVRSSLYKHYIKWISVSENVKYINS